MTSSLDLCNRALDEIAADSTISSFTAGSQAAMACNRWYDTCRRMLLGAAPWGFARRQAELTLLGSADDDTSIQPWTYKYLYPSNCIKVRYLLPPSLLSTSDAVLTGDYFVSGCGGWRGAPFKVANELNGVASRKVLLTNLQSASAVFVVDEETVDLFDDDFANALVALLASKLVMPMSASKELLKVKVAQAQFMVQEALACDANEGMPSTDSVPDWIAARGYGGAYYGGWLPGSYVGWDSISWSM